VLAPPAQAVTAPPANERVARTGRRRRAWRTIEKTKYNVINMKTALAVSSRFIAVFSVR
jgi:hypothetical protein